VLRDGEIQAQYKGIAFQHLFASPNNTIFVGLSNDGIPGTAIVVFDAEGDLRLLVNHENAEFNYCRVSVTRVRDWYDAEDPNVKFTPAATGRFPLKISVRDCHGKIVDLWEVVAMAYSKALEARQ
jgi:hypothetical protein